MPTNAAVIGSISVKARVLANSGYKRALPNFSVALYLLCAMVLGCSGGASNGGSPPTTPQAAPPGFNPVGGTFTAAQTVMLTDLTPGAAIYYTTTVGTTITGPTLYAAPFTVSSTSTISAYATASGYTQSNPASATFTINVPPATISGPAAFSINLNDDVSTLASTIYTCNGTCDFSKLTITVTPQGDKTQAGGVTFARWIADSSGKTMGNFYSGNSIPEDNNPQYAVHAVYGTSVVDSVLTVNILAPTLTKVTPAIISASGTRTLTLTGSNFAQLSATQNLTQFLGTEGDLVFGPCPTTQPPANRFASTGFISSTSITFTISGNLALGTLSVIVYTGPSTLGGGWACLPNAVTVTVSGIVVVGTANAVALDYASGTLRTTNSGVLRGTYNLGSRADSLIAVGNSVYATSPSQSAVAKLDIDSKSLHLISTGGYTPKLLAQSSSGAVYGAADLTSDANHTHGAILSIGPGYSAVVATADRFTSLSPAGSNLLWTAASTDGDSTVVNVFATNAGTTTPIPGFRKDATVVGISAATALVFTAGENEADVLDVGTMKVTGTVPFPSAIAQSSNGLFALMDGTIGRADISPDGSGKPVLSWTELAKQPLASLNSGFAISTAKDGLATLYVNQATSKGTTTLAMPIQLVP